MAQDVDSELVHKLAKLLEETGLGEIEYATDTWRIRVARPTAPVTTLAAPPFTAAAPVVAEAAPAIDHAGALKSPMVGTAYLAPDPQSSPFVSVGSSVVEGDTVMIIEAMKVMNTIPAHRSGMIKEILVTSGQPAEFGQVLMVIE
ncbi:MAG: acetyl-CoA carboxylase, biotin carboxyl carrier protein [Proteobacteria bacterium]|nr:acetyl-CoA carboxylase, biotin carboxyl carrier protein [Pseudomonadota bacterium]MDA1308888.1 acetyl-CoA carboxylase, biotin carboxyl carrier protein [Pseudomonadota bacterium]